MKTSRFRISDLFLVIAIVALGCGIYRLFWGPPFYNARIVFSIYLGGLTTAGIAIRYGPPTLRQFFLGYTAFGVMYLVTVLRAGYAWTPDSYAELFMRYSVMGVFLAVAFGLVSHLIARPKE